MRAVISPLWQQPVVWWNLHATSGPSPVNTTSHVSSSLALLRNITAAKLRPGDAEKGCFSNPRVALMPPPQPPPVWSSPSRQPHMVHISRSLRQRCRKTCAHAPGDVCTSPVWLPASLWCCHKKEYQHPSAHFSTVGGHVCLISMWLAHRFCSFRRAFQGHRCVTEMRTSDGCEEQVGGNQLCSHWVGEFSAISRVPGSPSRLPDASWWGEAAADAASLGADSPPLRAPPAGMSLWSFFTRWSWSPVLGQIATASLFFFFFFEIT